MNRLMIVLTMLTMLASVIPALAVGTTGAPPAPPPPSVISGSVTSISPTSGALLSFVVHPLALPGKTQPADATISVVGGTVYTNAGAAATSAAVKVGVNVDVMLSSPLKNNAGIAAQVNVVPANAPPPPPPANAIGGTVASISPTSGTLASFVVHPPKAPGGTQPADVTVSVTSSTTYTIAGKAATSAAVTVGAQVQVQLTAAPVSNAGTATQVDIVPAAAPPPPPPPPSVAGTVKSISLISGALKSFVVHPFLLPDKTQPADATISVTSSTKYVNGARTAASTDVKVGVNAQAMLQAPLSGNAGTATTVAAGVPPPPPPAK